MSLIRCPGCKLDTSDSLDHCPYCGAGLGGKPARVMEAQMGAVTADTPGGRFDDVPPVSVPGPQSREATVQPPNKLLQGVLGLIALVMFVAVPGGPAWVILGTIVYVVLRARKTFSGAKIEAFRRFAEQANAARVSGQKPAKRPLDLLRQIEAEIAESKRRGRS